MNTISPDFMRKLTIKERQNLMKDLKPLTGLTQNEVSVEVNVSISLIQLVFNGHSLHKDALSFIFSKLPLDWEEKLSEESKAILEKHTVPQ